MSSSARGQTGATWVSLVNGRKVNVLTEAGANEFVTFMLSTRPSKAQSLCDNFVKNVDKFRATLNDTNNSNIARSRRRQIIGDCAFIYSTIFGLASNCSRDIFNLGFSDADLQNYVDHCISVLTDLTNSRSWISTGVLEAHDADLFSSVAAFTSRNRFVLMIMQDSSHFGRVVANFIAAVHQKKNPHILPSSFVTERVVSITYNVRLTLQSEGWPDDKIFKKLESSGLLGQFLRCITLPSPSQLTILTFLDHLLKCPVFIQKKLCTGQPTGDLLNRLLTLQDGYKGDRDPEVMWRYRSLQMLASYASATNETEEDDDEEEDDDTQGLQSCRYCKKSSAEEEFQRSLKICSRCKQVFYCSKECQRADWKLHKPRCVPIDEAALKLTTIAQQMLQSFVLRNCYQVLKQVVEAMDRYLVHQSKLLLELDFFASIEPGAFVVCNKVHLAKRREPPALKSPPEFKVIPANNYRKVSCGGLGEEPDWFPKGAQKCEMTEASWQKYLEDQYTHMASTPDRIMALVRDASSGFSLYPLHLPSKPDGPSMFSYEPLDAFRRFLKDGETKPLDRVFSSELVMEFMLQRNLTVSPTK